MKKLKFAFVTYEDKIDLNQKDLVEFVSNHENFDQSILIKIKIQLKLLQMQEIMLLLQHYWPK